MQYYYAFCRSSESYGVLFQALNGRVALFNEASVSFEIQVNDVLCSFNYHSLCVKY